jgi:hypothetical protein
MCFTLNHQSIRGAAAVAASIQALRDESFRIFPVPTRLENAETDRLEDGNGREFLALASHGAVDRRVPPIFSEGNLTFRFQILFETPSG